MSFIGLKLSRHDYQLSMSYEIKCLWNYRTKLPIESGYYIPFMFYFTLYDMVVLKTTPWNSPLRRAWYTCFLRELCDEEWRASGRGKVTCDFPSASQRICTKIWLPLLKIVLVFISSNMLIMKIYSTTSIHS